MQRLANEHKERNFQFVECSYILCKDIANEHKERDFQFVECSYILCKDSLFPLLCNQYHQIIYQKQATKAIDLTTRNQSIHMMKTITLHDENCHFIYSSHTLSKPNCMDLYDKKNKIIPHSPSFFSTFIWFFPQNPLPLHAQT